MITSLRNSKVLAARKLRQRKHRQRAGRFLVEGLQLGHMALEAGYAPEQVFFCESLFTGTGAPSLLDRCRASCAELVEVSAEVMDALSERDAPQGLIAVFPANDRPLEALAAAADDLVLVLDRLQNPGNLGTLVRTADAVGAAAVVLLDPGADPYDPVAVRASMGSLFNLPLHRAAHPEAVAAAARDRGLRLVGADPARGELWYAAPWTGGVALVLGNEARGLSADVRECVQDWVRLPMRGKAESLNVAVVGGVLAYAWLRANGGEDLV